jgi:hypothetical protein
MFAGRLSLLAVREHRAELREAAEQRRRADPAWTPVTRVVVRYAAAADAGELRRLAALDSAPAPRGEALVAEVDGRVRAALPLDGSAAIADPFHRGLDLVELLQLRARHLAQA